MSSSLGWCDGLDAGDGLVDGGGDVVDVGGGHPAHGDAPTLQQVDVLRGHQELTLLN